MTAVTSFIGGLPRIPFATTLYSGNGGTQSIVTGKDNAAGSLTWIKNRSNSTNHALFDTVRGATKRLRSNDSTADATEASTLTAFSSDGFSVGGDSDVNASGSNHVAWTFLEQAGFFDIVSDSGTGVAKTQAHSLGAGSTVGAIIRKRLDTTSSWYVYHRSLNGGITPEQYYLNLNNNNQEAALSTIWNNTAPTDTVFSVGTNADVNASGGSYITYLFAHNPSAGIFCGSFTTDGSGNATVNCGWKAQWVLSKGLDFTFQNWQIHDKKRAGLLLQPDTAQAEIGGSVYSFAGSGFSVSGAIPNQEYIFIAIRDGV